MKEYTIYFEIFGKKMKTTIHAFSEERAIQILKSKIEVHKVEEKPTELDNNQKEYFRKIFGSFDGMF